MPTLEDRVKLLEALVDQLTGGEPSSKDPLVGKFFHRGSRERPINNQGLILSKIGDNYLVQLFSWIDGSPSTQELAAITPDAGFRFYGSAEEMGEAYDLWVLNGRPARSSP